MLIAVHVWVHDPNHSPGHEGTAWHLVAAEVADRPRALVLPMLWYPPGTMRSLADGKIGPPLSVDAARESMAASLRAAVSKSISAGEGAAHAGHDTYGLLADYGSERPDHRHDVLHALLDHIRGAVWRSLRDPVRDEVGRYAWMAMRIRPDAHLWPLGPSGRYAGAKWPDEDEATAPGWRPDPAESDRLSAIHAEAARTHVELAPPHIPMHWLRKPRWATLQMHMAHVLTHPEQGNLSTAKTADLLGYADAKHVSRDARKYRRRLSEEAARPRRSVASPEQARRS